MTDDPVVCLDGVQQAALVPALPFHPPRIPTLPQIRWLLRAALPFPTLDVTLALALVNYTQCHNLAAYRSHRKRTLQHLAQHTDDELSL